MNNDQITLKCANLNSIILNLIYRTLNLNCSTQQYVNSMGSLTDKFGKLKGT